MKQTYKKPKINPTSIGTIRKQNHWFEGEKKRKEFRCQNSKTPRENMIPWKLNGIRNDFVVCRGLWSILQISANRGMSALSVSTYSLIKTFPRSKYAYNPEIFARKAWSRRRWRSWRGIAESQIKSLWNNESVSTEEGNKNVKI